MNLKSDDISSWGSSLDDFKPEYTPVKVWSPIQMYRLMGRKSVIELDNFEPIPDLHYALLSPKEDKYYFKEFPDIPMWLMLFYKTDQDWDSYDVFLNDFRRRVADGNIYLLLTPEQVKDTQSKLGSLYRANLSDDGQLDYKTYIKIVALTLQYENYKDIGKSLTGYRSVCKDFDDKLAELWKSAHSLKKNYDKGK